MALRVFPVDASGHPSYSSEYRAARGVGGVLRPHGGNDIFASEGTPVLAVDDGRVRYSENHLGGQVAYLTTDDGAYYYYAHLSGFEGGDRRVAAGDVLGYVGHTGNAASTPSHLHFEIHPTGDKTTTDPYPILRAAQGLDVPASSASSASSPRPLVRTPTRSGVGDSRGFGEAFVVTLGILWIVRRK